MSTDWPKYWPCPSGGNSSIKEDRHKETHNPWGDRGSFDYAQPWATYQNALEHTCVCICTCKQVHISMGRGPAPCVFTRSTVIFESLLVFRYKCDQKRMFNCNSQSIMQIQIDVSDVKCLSNAITLEGIYLLLICFCHYKLRINTVLFLAYGRIKIREWVWFHLWGKRHGIWEMGQGGFWYLVKFQLLVWVVTTWPYYVLSQAHIFPPWTTVCLFSNKIF